MTAETFFGISFFAALKMTAETFFVVIGPCWWLIGG
jgi:hypothetical protein